MEKAGQEPRERSVAIRRVLVLYRGSLLTQGVERLLRNQGKIEVAGVALNDEAALDSVLSFHPDVVIVDSGELHLEIGWLLLEEHPGLRVICLRSRDAQARLVSCQPITVNNVQELLQVVEGG